MADSNEFMDVKPSGRGWNLAWSLLVFFVVYALFSAWPFPVIHPSVWEDVTIAAGLRPPDNPFPGLYRGILSLLFKNCPRETVFQLLPHLGRGCVAFAAVCVYLIFCELLPAALRLRSHVRNMGLRLGRAIAFLSAVVFACAEPVWRAGETFSPVSVFLVLALASCSLFFHFVRRGSLGVLYLCFALLGFLTTETTLGFLLLILAIAGVLVAVRWARNPNGTFVNPLVDGLVRAVVFKRLTYVWLAAFIGGVALNVGQFIQTGGMAATGHIGVLGLLFEYFRGAYEATRAAATGPGWLFALLFAVAPFIFTINLLPQAWNDDRFLPWRVGMCAGVTGLIALSQLAGARTLWFWTWLGTAREMISSDIFLSFVLFFDVATLAFVLTVFGVDAYCRNYRRIAKQQFPESMLSEAPAQLAESLGRARKWRKTFFLAISVVVLALVIPGRVQTVPRAMAQAIADSVAETLAETKGCETIFTDGSFDSLIELEAYRQGRPIIPLSLMSPNTARARLLRCRAAANDEDRALLENDAATALRDWVANRPDRLAKSAVQIGFEMWKRVKKPQPPFSGLVARPGGVDAAERARALAVCKELSDRVEKLSRVGKKDDEGRAEVERVTDAALRRKFPFIAWRLSRLAQMRSQAADLAGDRKQAELERTMADKLDAANASVQEMNRKTNWLKMQTGGQLTPREGLIIGLSRADFAFAGKFAAPVLAADPDDPRANFALGMMYYQEEQYGRAEPYLLRCLVRRPNEPAVLNNLALVEKRLGKFDEAEKHVDQALKKHPDLPELKQTKEAIRKARTEAAAATVVPAK